MRPNVVLPDPDSPTRPMTVPSATDSETSSTARVMLTPASDHNPCGAKSLLRLRASISDDPPVGAATPGTADGAVVGRLALDTSQPVVGSLLAARAGSCKKQRAIWPGPAGN